MRHPMLDDARRQEIIDVISPVPVCKTLRFRIDQLDDGFCRLFVPFDASLVGLYGLVHGGILMTIADSVACFAIMTRTGPRRPMVTTDMNIRFLGPCKGHVVADARVLKFGRTMCPVTVDLFDEAQKRVAVAQVTYMLLEKAPQA